MTYYAIGDHMLAVTYDEWNSEQIIRVDLQRSADLLLGPSAAIENLDPDFLITLAEGGALSSVQAAHLADLASGEAESCRSYYSRTVDPSDLYTAHDWEDAAEACEEAR